VLKTKKAQVNVPETAPISGNAQYAAGDESYMALNDIFYSVSTLYNNPPDLSKFEPKKAENIKWLLDRLYNQLHKLVLYIPEHGLSLKDSQDYTKYFGSLVRELKAEDALGGYSDDYPLLSQIESKLRAFTPVEILKKTGVK
jgi:hypothetical protein